MNSPIADSLNLAEENPGVCGLHVRSQHTTQVNRITLQVAVANPSTTSKLSDRHEQPPARATPTNNLNQMVVGP